MCGGGFVPVMLLALMLGLQGICAQESSSDAQTPAAVEAPAENQQASVDQQAPVDQPAPENAGLLNTLGGWIRNSADGVSSGLKGTQQRLDDLNKGAIDTIARLPSAGMATGRAACQVAANGAPDCYAAAETLCKGKGFNSGKSLLSESAETCKPRVLIPGYKRKEGDCRIDTFVTRASCS